MKNIYKRLSLVCLLVIMVMVSGFSYAEATSQLPRVVDRGQVLTEEEKSSLREQVNEISQRQKFDVVIATVKNTGEKNVAAAAQDFYDYNGYGYGEKHNGIIFFISMEDRKWSIQTTGYGLTAFTDAGIDYIEDQILTDLSDGNYATSFETFATLSDDYVRQAKESNPYDVHNLPGDEENVLMRIIVSIIVGFIIANAWAKFKKSKMITIEEQQTANDYTDQSSITLTKNEDYFVKEYVTTYIIERDKGGSSTSIGSSGTEHGGDSGSF